jgi:hypothetical protein
MMETFCVVPSALKNETVLMIVDRMNEKQIVKKVEVEKGARFNRVV